MDDKIHPPWTSRQVKGLRYWQESGLFHPYTCPHDHHDVTDEPVLTPTKHGWVCEWCDYTQDWAHAFSARRLPDAASS